MNVVELREFYSSPLGKATQRLVAGKLISAFDTTQDRIILGLGFAPPYLDSNDRNLAFMTARRGVIHWPDEGLVQSSLVDELDLPLPDNSVDYALVVHGLEFTESPVEMLQEVWRVLAPQGKLLLVVPNRRGLWSASEATPFGYGQPFSRSQINRLLRDAQFSLTKIQPALLMPPRVRLLSLQFAAGLEKYGAVPLGRFAGVFVVEATKQVLAYSAGKRVRRLMPGFRPLLLPTHKSI
jgi:SAM-dependent methyltransferase